MKEKAIRRRTIIIALASLAIGCGLVSGLDTLHVGDDAAVDSAVDDASADAIVIPTCDGGCRFALPSGFALATYATTLPATCPNGTTTQAVVVDPTVSSDACSCRCTMTTKGTCSSSTVQLLVGDGGLSSCTGVYALLSGTPGCHTTTFTLTSQSRVDNNPANPVLADAGACGTSEVADASTLAAPPAQVCAPTSCAASEALCTPPPGQRLCVVSAGDVACPAPFTEKHSAGTSASLQCSNCASTCTIGPQTCSSGNGKLTLYTNSTCSTGSQSAQSCFSIGAGDMQVKSYDFVNTPSGSCTTTATSSSSTVLKSQETICCRPGN